MTGPSYEYEPRLRTFLQTVVYTMYYQLDHGSPLYPYKSRHRTHKQQQTGRHSTTRVRKYPEVDSWQGSHEPPRSVGGRAGCCSERVVATRGVGSFFWLPVDESAKSGAGSADFATDAYCAAILSARWTATLASPARAYICMRSYTLCPPLLLLSFRQFANSLTRSPMTIWQPRLGACAGGIPSACSLALRRQMRQCWM